MTPGGAGPSAGRVWFITGSSSGFGLELARAALERGDRVAATARRPDALEKLVAAHPGRAAALELDVTDAEQTRTAVAAAVRQFGRLDIVVNNAGYGTLGALEGFTDAEVRRQVETNLMGPLHVTRAVLPHLRAQRSGHLVQMSSVGGQVVFAGGNLYHATKWGLEGLSQALAAELAPLGIRVTIVEPGPFATGFVEAMDVAEPVAEYAPIIESTLRMFQAITPGDPAAAIGPRLKAIDDPAAPLRVPLGRGAVDLIGSELRSRAGQLERAPEIVEQDRGRTEVD